MPPPAPGSRRLNISTTRAETPDVSRRGVARAVVCVVIAVACVVAVGASAAPATATVGGATTDAPATPSATAGETRADAPATVEDVPPNAAASDPPVDDVSNETNTTQHQNPDEAGESGDLERVRRHLAGRLSETLAQRTVELSQGEYEAANRTLGGFDSQLSKYVDVAGETGRDGDAAGRQFRETRDRQREFARELQQYRETREAYRRAVRNGNETRARALGRALARQAENVSETGSDLETTLENTSRLGGGETARVREAITAVENTTTNATTVRREVVEREFTETRLQARATAERASFRSPARVTGRLVAADGTPLAGQTVVVDTGRRTVTAETDDTGRFSLRVRPTTLAVGDRSVTVAYRPADTSVYLGANTTVDFAVEQTTGSLRVDGPETARYGETLVVEGRLAVGDTPVSGFPVAVLLGERRLGTATTGQTGEFTLTAAVPADVPAGDRELTVVPAVTERGVTAAPATTTVTVGETATRLNLTVDELSGSTLELFGVLQTRSGTPVTDRRVTVQLDGQPVTTVSTADGRFAATVDLPPAVQSADAVTVSVVFDGAGTNLDGATASRRVTLGGAGEGTSDDTLDTTTVALVVGALVLVGGLALVWLLLGRDGDPAAGRGPARDDESTATSDETPATAVEAAAAAVENGDPRTAVTLAVAGLRASLGTAPAATYRDLERRVDGDRRDRLAAVLDAYERVTFAGDDLDGDRARRAVETAREVVEEDS